MGRNAEMNRAARDVRREQILTASLRLFASRGVFATKIADIVAAAGASQGLVYHYFASKEEIFATLIREAFERMNEACRMLEGLPLTPVEKLRLAAEKLLDGVAQNEDTALYHLLIAQATASDAIPDETKAVIREHNRFPYETMTRIFAEGQRKGQFRRDPPEMLALVFWTAIKGICIHKATHRDDCAVPNVEILMRMFVKDAPAQGVVTRKGRRAR